VGNGLQTRSTFDPLSGRLTNIGTRYPSQTPLQDLDYDWDVIGNLESRTKWNNRSLNQSLIEGFKYDNLNRLTFISLNGLEQIGTHQYDIGGLGNLTSKKADGQVLFSEAQYGEGNHGPHAITSAITSPDIFPSVQQHITYNSFDKVIAIDEGIFNLDIQYGTNRQRIEQQFTDTKTTITKRWAGACEYITTNGKQNIITYLSGPNGVFALHSKNADGSEALYYIHKDHLGSWNTITDESGNLMQELSFDAWGVRRDPSTWKSFTGTPPQPMFDRGFTGHEHLYGFNLINMNGRVYDPVVSRMLSPDNFVQSPDFSQSFNRYSYCANNPLAYTDPSGNVSFAMIGLAFRVLILGGDFISNVVNGVDNPGQTAWDNMNSTVNGMNSCLQVPIYNKVNTSVNYGIQPLNFGTSISVTQTSGQNTYTASVGYGPGGWKVGGGFTHSQDNWEIGAGIAAGPNVIGGGISGKVNGYGGSYYFTHYFDAPSPDAGGRSMSQNVGGVKLYFDEVTFSIENDFLAGSGDKGRSSALELSYGAVSVGTHLFTNKGEGDVSGEQHYDRNGKAYSTWINGKVYSSPLFFGIRYDDQVVRFGYSFKEMQQKTQNWVHEHGFPVLTYLNVGFQNYYLDYTDFYRGPYAYGGYYNPYSIWGR